jgi:type II secretion system protein D
MKKQILILLMAGPLYGQAPPIPGLVPDPVDPVDPPPVVVLAEKPDPMALAVPRGQRFEFPNIDGRTAAGLYYKHTGIRVLVSQAAAGAEISIVQPGPLTNMEAANLLEKRLLMEGIALIPSGPDEVKMVMQQAPMWEGPKVYGNIEELPEGDEFINYVMALEYLKPEEAQRAFTSLVGQFGPSGKVAAIPNASSLIISANTPLVRMLIELKNRIDVPSARVGTKFIEVEYADVEELAERLNEIFNNQRQSNQSARVQRTGNTPQIPGIPANAGNAAAGGSGGAGEDITLNILPDTRTNRIFLMGRPVDLVFVEGLIADFDAPSSKRNFLRRKLKYLPVAEFLPVAENALERTGTVTGGGATGSRSSSSRSSTSRTTGSTSSNNRNLTSNNRTGTTGTGGTGGSRASLNAQDITTAPESILVGKTLLVADQISNSVVVQGPPHHVEVIEKLIDELDVPSEQIAITAVFGRYDIGKNRSFGIDLANILSRVGGDFSLAGTLRTGVPSVVDPRTLGDLASVIAAPNAAGNGLSLYGALGDDFGVFVNALESNDNFTAISRPTVFTTNNHEARISSGSRIAVPTSTFQGGSSTGFSTNVEFRDIVLELVVLPLVNDLNEVTLQISLVRDNTGENRFIEGFGNVPDIDTDEISTTVTVPNRATIILGGLITESDKDSHSGIPVLSSIPGIGRLFGSTDKEVDREELVIMIHPSIIYSNSQLEGYQNAYDLKSTVAPKARGSVENSGLLPSKGSLQPSAGTFSPAAKTVSRPRSQPLIQPATSPSQRALQNKLRNKRRR